MTEDFTNTMEAQTVAGKAGFTRVGNGPAGSHALSGQWRMDTKQAPNPSGPFFMQTEAPGHSLTFLAIFTITDFDGQVRVTSCRMADLLVS